MRSRWIRMLTSPPKIESRLQHFIDYPFYDISFDVRLSSTAFLCTIIYITYLQASLKDSLLYILFLSNNILYIPSSIHQKPILMTYFGPDFFIHVFIMILNTLYIFSYCYLVV